MVSTSVFALKRVAIRSLCFASIRSSAPLTAFSGDDHDIDSLLEEPTPTTSLVSRKFHRSVFNGTVVNYVFQGGYGFIRPENSAELVFIHCKDIAKKNPAHRYRTLRPGEQVMFEISFTPKGLCAKKVTGPNGAPVEGLANANEAYTKQEVNKAPKSVLAQRVQGTVISAYPQQKIGYINITSLQRTLVYHAKNIIRSNPQHSATLLRKGEIVEFDVAETMFGWEAINVTAGPSNSAADPNGSSIVSNTTLCRTGNSSSRYQNSGSSGELVERHVQSHTRYRPKLLPTCSNSAVNANMARTKQQINSAPKPVLAQRAQGTVISFFPKHKIGYINVASLQRTFIYHVRNIAQPNPQQSEVSLRKGELVEFDLAETMLGWEAINITGPSYSPVCGADPNRSSVLCNTTLSDVNNITNSTTKSENTVFSGELIERHLQGYVTWYDPKLEYGYVFSSRLEKRFVVHRRHITTPNPDHVVASLCKGEAVVFDVCRGVLQSYKAVNVTGPGGAPVKGSLECKTSSYSNVPPLVDKIIQNQEQEFHLQKRILNTRKRKGLYACGIFTRGIISTVRAGDLFCYAGVKLTTIPELNQIAVLAKCLNV